MSAARPSAPPSGRTDPAVHKRYLEYREKHAYFGNQLVKLIAMSEFEPLDAEHRVLDAMGEDGRDDDEEARYAEISAILFRD
jgi:hypothetical protein